MLPAAVHTGGYSTLDLLAGIAILIWAFAGTLALLGWAARVMRQRPWRAWSLPRAARRLIARRRARAMADQAAVRPVLAPRTAAETNAGSEQASGPTAPTVVSSSVPSSTRALGETSEVGATRSKPPANPGARYTPETLEPLGQHLDNSRRLAVVEAHLAPIVCALPHERWLVERYVLIDSQRIPFLILGETGVFALWALGGPVQWSTIPVLGQTAERVKITLPGYSGTVHAGVVRALAPDLKARWWCRPGEPGAWVMGLNWVIPWLEHFDSEHGLGIKDVEHLRRIAGPHWGHPVRDTPLSAHIPGIDRLPQG